MTFRPAHARFPELQISNLPNSNAMGINEIIYSLCGKHHAGRPFGIWSRCFDNKKRANRPVRRPS
ncbi:MAG: hypothetical protein RLZZ09_813 [Pseudomonadota bacterium]|jgi:hypothetical protein